MMNESDFILKSVVKVGVSILKNTQKVYTVHNCIMYNRYYCTLYITVHCTLLYTVRYCTLYITVHCTCSFVLKKTVSLSSGIFKVLLDIFKNGLDLSINELNLSKKSSIYLTNC